MQIITFEDEIAMLANSRSKLINQSAIGKILGGVGKRLPRFLPYRESFHVQRLLLKNQVSRCQRTLPLIFDVQDFGAENIDSHARLRTVINLHHIVQQFTRLVILLPQTALGSKR